MTTMLDLANCYGPGRVKYQLLPGGLVRREYDSRIVGGVWPCNTGWRIWVQGRPNKFGRSHLYPTRVDAGRAIALADRDDPYRLTPEDGDTDHAEIGSP